MHRVPEHGVDVLWRVAPHVARDRENEVTDRPFALRAGFATDRWTSADLDDVEYINELLNESCAGPRNVRREVRECSKWRCERRRDGARIGRDDSRSGAKGAAAFSVRLTQNSQAVAL